MTKLVTFWEKLQDDDALNIKVSLSLLLPGLVLYYLIPRVWSSGQTLVRGISLIFLISAYIISGWMVIVSAFRELKQKNWMNEFFLMTIATFGALALGAWAEAAAIMIFYNIGEYAEHVAMDRSKASISGLLELAPENCLLWRDDEWRECPIEEAKAGDRIRLRAGDRVPLDFTVTRGEGTLDVSALTGESLPRTVGVGDQVLSGSLNLQSVLEGRVDKCYQESTLSRIIQLGQEAAARKSQRERIISRFAHYYTPIVVGLALFFAFVVPLITGQSWLKWFTRSLNLLVISCPCALVLSVPLGFFMGLGLASSKGILVKGSDVLEKICRVDKIIFDKTGTLSTGKLAVEEVTLHSDHFSREQVLAITAALEAVSNHVIAEALRSLQPGQTKLEINQLQELAGRGVQGQLDDQFFYIGNERLMNELALTLPEKDSNHTLVYLAYRETADSPAELLASFALSDQLRDDAHEAVQELHQRGVHKVAMYSGDREEAVAEQARKLGMDDYAGNLLPQHKLARLEADMAAKTDQSSVVFVGDGINDAPALSLADVGIAMGEVGSDVAVKAADVVLMSDELLAIPQLLDVSRQTLKIVKENIGLALGLKILIAVLSLVGIGGMWLAIFADVGVTLLCVANSYRLRIK